MRKDNSSSCKFGCQFAQPRHKKLVRKAMKSVAPNTCIGKPARQSESLGQIRLAAMKGRVEASELRYLRRSVQDCANGSEWERDCAVGEAAPAARLHEVVEHIRRYPHWAIIVDAAMDNAMTEAGHSRSLQ